MHPLDELKEIARFDGPGVLVADGTGEWTNVQCHLKLYQQWLWCGDGEPREKGGRDIAGKVEVPANKYWARNRIGKTFSLDLGNGRQLHLRILDDGSIGNAGDSIWPCD